MSGDVLSFEGTVLAEHRGDLFEVEVTIGDSKRSVLAKRSGRLVKHRLRILPGDVVQLEVSPYDTTRGRIVYRGKREELAG